jgi:hypothetical protein
MVSFCKNVINTPERNEAAVRIYAVGLKMAMHHFGNLNVAGWTPAFASGMSWTTNDSNYEKK